MSALSFDENPVYHELMVIFSQFFAILLARLEWIFSMNIPGGGTCNL
jgi:hypothetical protein